MLNTWVPALTVNVRCNNDIKLLSNSRETMNVAFYITSYQTKKQGRNFNMSAVLAKGFAYHVKRTSYNETIRDQQRLLLFRLVNTINLEQELAAPMVVSYLMGWGDTYHSHRYTSIYWSTFVGQLLRVFPYLEKRGEPPTDADKHINNRCENVGIHLHWILTLQCYFPQLLIDHGPSIRPDTNNTTRNSRGKTG